MTRQSILCCSESLGPDIHVDATPEQDRDNPIKHLCDVLEQAQSKEAPLCNPLGLSGYTTNPLDSKGHSQRSRARVLGHPMNAWSDCDLGSLQRFKGGCLKKGFSGPPASVSTWPFLLLLDDQCYSLHLSVVYIGQELDNWMGCRCAV